MSSSIAIYTTNMPGVPLDVFSCPVDPPLGGHGEALLINKASCNQNCRPVPAAALKELLAFLEKKNPKLASQCGATPEDAVNGRVTGFLFVSKNKDGLETLHGALRSFRGKVRKLCLADIYGADTLCGARMEGGGCVAGGFNAGVTDIGHSLVYVSTVDQKDRTRGAVYKTNLADGKTERLTPPGQYDLSPAVSPSGDMVAVASLRWNKSTGEMENLKTDIVVMNVDRKAQGGLRRKILIRDGGWPTWGSDKVIFFHRGIDTGAVQPTWAVFRYDISTDQTTQVTPVDFDAVTPAAISKTKVAVATIRHKSGQAERYRHIEIFDVNAGPDDQPAQITKKIRPNTDHYNPFILDAGSRVGYYSKKKRFHAIASAMVLMWSWLNSDLWQRATAKMKEMVEPSSWPLPNFHSWVPNWEPCAMSAWPWTWSMPRPKLYACARSCVVLALVLLAAILVGRYMDRRDRLLEQPGWSDLEKAMVATVHREVNITSSLSGASIEYLSKATNRYLYLAIVHASSLRSRFRPEDLTLLRGKVGSLEAEKKILRAKHDTLVKEIDDLADNSKALGKAESRITELRQQLDMPVQEKKTILKREK